MLHLNNWDYFQRSLFLDKKEEETIEGGDEAKGYDENDIKN